MGDIEAAYGGRRVHGPVFGECYPDLAVVEQPVEGECQFLVGKGGVADGRADAAVAGLEHIVN